MMFKKIISKFINLLNLDVKIDEKLLLEAKQFIEANSDHIIADEEINSNFFKIVTEKLDLYKEAKKNIIDFLAKQKTYLNYNEKKILSENINNKFSNYLNNTNININKKNLPKIQFISDKDIQILLKNFLLNPVNNRTKKIDKNLSDKIISSIFSSFIYRSIPKKIANDYFISKSNFKLKDPHLCIIDLKNQKNELEYIKKAASSLYDTLPNYSTLAIIIPFESNSAINNSWKIALDTIFYLEKFKTNNLNHSFYKSKLIFEKTKKTIKDNNLKLENFKNIHFGYTYNDTFVCLEKKENHLVLIFKLNKFSNEILPCPSCLSDKVDHNSFSSLGIKSLECSNMLCPERSLSFRGKRYSFSSIYKQNSINNKNKIEKTLIRQWSRDVVKNINFDDITTMLQNFHSINNSKILYFGSRKIKSINKRTINKKNLNFFKNVKYENISDDYFARYLYPSINKKKNKYKEVKIDKHKFYLGDSYDVLRDIKSESIDGAITSPPYYNAKEYSQWDNIFSYLYDMRKIIKEVYRTLKKDSLFLFNIFDYFDNEKDIVLSAMGNKRISLSSLINTVFVESKFKLLGNIVWDKGHIEGKRGFNAGNETPYYQKPFNCWEHILVYGKKAKENKYHFPLIFEQTAVHKIIKKKNIIGHTAPFPLELSDLLVNKLEKNKIILDPFAGVFTTSISAKTKNINSISIEKNKEFFKAGLERFNLI